LATQRPAGEDNPASPLAINTAEERTTNNSFFMGAPQVE
jgi:hypothetical protein